MDKWMITKKRDSSGLTEIIDGPDCENTIVADASYILKLKRDLETATKALEFYGDPEKWAQFVSDGGIFGEQDGDFVEAFNSENPDEGSTARMALMTIKGEKDSKLTPTADEYFSQFKTDSDGAILPTKKGEKGEGK